MSDLMHELKAESEASRISVVLMAQFTKTRERGAKWRYPDVEAIRGSASIIEMADTILLLSRAVDPAKAEAFKNYVVNGEGSPETFERLNTMLVHLAKSRIGLPLRSIKLHHSDQGQMADDHDWHELNPQDRPLRVV